MLLRWLLRNTLGLLLFEFCDVVVEELVEGLDGGGLLPDDGEGFGEFGTGVGGGALTQEHGTVSAHEPLGREVGEGAQKTVRVKCIAFNPGVHNAFLF